MVNDNDVALGMEAYELVINLSLKNKTPTSPSAGYHNSMAKYALKFPSRHPVN